MVEYLIADFPWKCQEWRAECARCEFKKDFQFAEEQALAVLVEAIRTPVGGHGELVAQSLVERRHVSCMCRVGAKGRETLDV
jgi:hypothetical protein